MVCALVAYAVARGQSVPWDLRNYHWYDAWAWWHGRDRDLAPAQLQSFFAPLLHVPFWLLATHVPARIAVAALAFVQVAANATLAFAIVRRVLPVGRARDWLASGAATVGALGSTQIVELGATMGDNLVSIGLLAALLLLLPAIADGGQRTSRCAFAGFSCGAMVGLKLACAPVALGIFVASAFAARSLRGRLAASGTFALAAAIALALVAGPWFLRMWQAYGNPLHPYFAGLFGTEWVPPYPSGDVRYHVRGIVDALLRPWALVHDWRATSELRFRDLRLVALLASAIAWAMLRRGVDEPVRRPIDALIVAFLATWIAWLAAFGYYRYLAAWELVAPGLAAAVLLATKRATWRAALGVLVLLAVTTNPPEATRVPFRHAFLEQDGVALASGPAALVLLVGDEPTAYVVPQLGQKHAYARVSGNYAGWPLPPWRADEAIAARIESDPAPLLVLHQASPEAVAPALARFGVAMDAASCETVRTSWAVASEPLIVLCRAERRVRARDALARAEVP
ncbi:MAG TPA: hypothetical protein VFL14_12675 [Xanthomonadales bacterium]|nr:hypothetical protein [Xanthomonadales bacterium]